MQDDTMSGGTQDQDGLQGRSSEASGEADVLVRMRQAVRDRDDEIGRIMRLRLGISREGEPSFEAMSIGQVALQLKLKQRQVDVREKRGLDALRSQFGREAVRELRHQMPLPPSRTVKPAEKSEVPVAAPSGSFMSFDQVTQASKQSGSDVPERGRIQHILEAIDGLSSERVRQVLQLKIGIRGKKGATIEEIANALGISSEAVRIDLTRGVERLEMNDRFSPADKEMLRCVVGPFEACQPPSSSRSAEALAAKADADEALPPPPSDLAPGHVPADGPAVTLRRSVELLHQKMDGLKKEFDGLKELVREIFPALPTDRSDDALRLILERLHSLDAGLARVLGRQDEATSPSAASSPVAPVASPSSSERGRAKAARTSSKRRGGKKPEASAPTPVPTSADKEEPMVLNGIGMTQGVPWTEWMTAFCASKYFQVKYKDLCEAIAREKPTERTGRFAGGTEVKVYSECMLKGIVKRMQKGGKKKEGGNRKK